MRRLIKLIYAGGAINLFPHLNVRCLTKGG